LDLPIVALPFNQFIIQINPVGLAFSSGSQNFYVVEDQGPERALAANSRSLRLHHLPIEETWQVSLRSLNIIFDDRNKRLLAFQPTAGQLVEIREHPVRYDFDNAALKQGTPAR
jgi:hypothetical protein